MNFYLVPKYIVSNILEYVDYKSFLNFGLTCKEYYNKYYLNSTRPKKWINKYIKDLKIKIESFSSTKYYCEYGYYCSICRMLRKNNITGICNNCSSKCSICNIGCTIKFSNTKCHKCGTYVCIPCYNNNKYIGKKCTCQKFTCVNCEEYLIDCRTCYRKKCDKCIKNHGNMCYDCKSYINIL
jgi:hypothetical protein